jgi:hypothetical protein
MNITKTSFLSALGFLILSASTLQAQTIPESTGTCSFAAYRGKSCSASFHTCPVTNPRGVTDSASPVDPLACQLTMTVKCGGRISFRGFYSPSTSGSSVALSGIPSSGFPESPTLIISGLKKLPSRMPSSLNVGGRTRRGSCFVKPVAAGFDDDVIDPTTDLGTDGDLGLEPELSIDKE